MQEQIKKLIKNVTFGVISIEEAKEIARERFGSEGQKAIEERFGS